MTPNELALVVFLFVLITAAGWLPRVGDWLGSFVLGVRRGATSSNGTGGKSREDREKDSS